jgi:general secretion pathway protein G
MIVLTIIAILVDLRTLRDVIDQYTADKKKAPQSLQDLVQAGYFKKELPLDPMTGNRDWRTEFGTDVSSPDQTETGIIDVHSLSNALSSEGTTYDTW